MSKIPTDRPRKPVSDLPVFLHASGQYCWKYRGRWYYLGTDPEAAIDEYLRINQHIRAGRTPPLHTTGLTVHSLLDQYLAAADGEVAAGRITRATWKHKLTLGRRVWKFFGNELLVSQLTAQDFTRLRNQLSEGVTPNTATWRITHTRCFFTWAKRIGLIDTLPIFGPGFTPPKDREVEAHRYAKRLERGPRMWTAEEIRAMLLRAKFPPYGPTWQAMILLGIGCGFEPHDIISLPIAALPVQGQSPAWLYYPRPKTGVRRSLPLWPCLITTLQRAIEARPKPRTVEAEPLIFLRPRGAAWGTLDASFYNRFRELTRAAGVFREGVGFLGFRHAFATIGSETGDTIAVSALLGHRDPMMISTYREGLAVRRLLAVSSIIHRWLFHCTPQSWESASSEAVLPFLSNRF